MWEFKLFCLLFVKKVAFCGKFSILYQPAHILSENNDAL